MKGIFLVFLLLLVATINLEALPLNNNSTRLKVEKQVQTKIYIHLMPWFETKETSEDGLWGIHWTMAKMDPDIINGTDGRRQIASYFYPEIGPYGSGDLIVIDYQIQMMKYSGVDGVLMDWPGTTKAWDYPKNMENSDKFIQKMEAAGLDFAIVYEDHNLGMAHDDGYIEDMLIQGREDMEYLESNYFSKSNYVKINDRPLLLTFGPQSLGTDTDWTFLFQTLNPKPTFLTLWNQKQQAGENAQGEYPWVYFNFLDGLTQFYNYRPLDVKFGVAYPGFLDFYMDGGWGGHPGWNVPHNGVESFKQTLDLALSAEGVNWIQIATWNDYGEGTMIEPTREFGNGFLNVLQNTLGVPYGNRELNLIKELYARRKQLKSLNNSKEEINQLQLCLDSVNSALNNLMPGKAKELLDNCN